MSKVVSKTITSCCTDNGAALKLSFESSVITKKIVAILEKRLLKKGVGLNWVDEHASPDLLLRIVEINQGNQFLRWLLPFIAPATLEIEGQVAVESATPQQFHYVQRTQFGLLGGSARSMLMVCAQRVSERIANDVSRSLKG